MCQKALEEAKGDLVKARDILRKKGAEVAEKKADRETSEGAIFTYIHHNKKIGSMVSLWCETDFVARNSDFQQLGNEIAMQVASTNPKDIKELMTSPFIKDPKTTIEQLVKDNILKLGENMSIGNFIRYEI
jgi:elongation factor Ts